jgi:hypothetical protein
LALCGSLGWLRASDEILNPEPETVISTWNYGQVDRSAAKLVDGSGLEFQLHHGDAIPSTWPKHSTNVVAMQTSSSEVFPTMVFTLPEVCDVRGLHYWNYNVPVDTSGDNSSGGHRSVTPPAGIRGLEIWTSLAGATGPYDLVGTYEFAQSLGSTAYSGETLALGRSVRARYVKFVVTSGYGEKAVGLSELRFLGQPAPELRMTTAGTDLVVSWPAPASGYRLEKFGLSDSGNRWEAVAEAPQLLEGRFSRSFPTGDGAQLFRLVQLVP